MMPSCLKTRWYEADIVASVPFLLLCKLDFAAMRLSIRPYPTFHTVRFLRVFQPPS